MSVWTLLNVQQYLKKSLARTDGVEYDVAIDGYLAKFRATAPDTRQLSDWEEQLAHN